MRGCAGKASPPKARVRTRPTRAIGQVSGRHCRIRDLMRTLTTLEDVPGFPAPRYVARPQNVGNATTQGVELEAKFRLNELVDDAPAVDLRANVSLFNSTVDSVPGPNNRLDSQP